MESVYKFIGNWIPSIYTSDERSESVTIVLPTIYDLETKIKKKLDKFTEKINSAKIIQWLGYPSIGNLFYTYLLNKYKSNCLLAYNGKIGIEINGDQHYQKLGILTEYHQKRHDEIEQVGWKLLEIHYLKVYNEKFLEELLN